MWNIYIYTPKEKEDGIKRYVDLLERVEDAKRRRAAAKVAAMPVIAASAAGSRQPTDNAGSGADRVRMRELLEDKLDQAVFDIFGMVARVVSQAEIDKPPERRLKPKKYWIRNGKSFRRKHIGSKKRYVNMMTLPSRHAKIIEKSTLLTHF